MEKIYKYKYFEIRDRTYLHFQQDVDFKKAHISYSKWKRWNVADKKYSWKMLLKCFLKNFLGRIS